MDVYNHKIRAIDINNSVCILRAAEPPMSSRVKSSAASNFYKRQIIVTSSAIKKNNIGFSHSKKKKIPSYDRKEM